MRGEDRRAFHTVPGRPCGWGQICRRGGADQAVASSEISAGKLVGHIPGARAPRRCARRSRRTRSRARRMASRRVDEPRRSGSAAPADVRDEDQDRAEQRAGGRAAPRSRLTSEATRIHRPARVPRSVGARRGRSDARPRPRARTAPSGRRARSRSGPGSAGRSCADRHGDDERDRRAEQRTYWPSARRYAWRGRAQGPASISVSARAVAARTSASPRSVMPPQSRPPRSTRSSPPASPSARQPRSVEARRERAATAGPTT